MRKEVYKRHIENFSQHWWFQARKQIIDGIIFKFIKKKKLNILDFGSGSGVNLKMLSKYGKVNIYEPHHKTKNYLKKNYKNKKKFKVLNHINNNKFDLIILADVLEHLKNDKKELLKLKKCLNKKGLILITVPAYKFLFSKKDEILGHYRRYNKEEIKKLFKNFNPIKLTYFNFLLFFPISISIIILKILRINFIDEVEKMPNGIINKLLFIIFILEKEIIKNFNLPFGISLLGLFKKK